MTVFTESFDIGDGRIVSIETGKLARQADGAVLVRMGKAALLATICIGLVAWRNSISTQSMALLGMLSKSYSTSLPL